MKDIVQVGLSTCTNCASINFNYYESGGHDAFVYNPILQNDIRNFVGSESGTTVSFTGLATATFPTQTPSNPATNTGILTQRWYVDGYGPLTDGTNVALGITVVGAATTTLLITGASSPRSNGLGFFMRPDYIPSAYSRPLGSAVVAGTARSTGNGNNEPYDSSVATLTVYPIVRITSQPSDSTVAATVSTTFNVFATASDSSTLSYQWLLNGSNLTDSSLVSGSNTPSLTIASNTVGVSTVQAVVTHPTSCDSPKYSDVATFTSVDPRQIIVIEDILSESSASVGSYNLFDYKEISLGSDPVNLIKVTPTPVSLFASEGDIYVEMELHGSIGASYGSNRGGNGGYSKVRFTMRKDEEYVFAGLGAPTGSAIFLYRKSRLIASIGNGGDAYSNGRGGDGGGVFQGGERGQGRGGGNGGEYISPGNLSFPGIFGSESGLVASQLQSGDRVAPIPFGGRAIPCGRGNGTVSPCTDLGRVQFLWGQSTPVPGTARINRGFKQGYGIRNTPGRGSGGGDGGGGTTGGDGGTSSSGGGGGGGYTDGSVKVIESIRGGSQYSRATVIIRLVSTATVTQNVTDTEGSISVGSPFTVTRVIDPGITGTEGHPVGSIRYIVNISDYFEPTLSARVLNPSLRASGLIDPDNSIAVSAGYPKQLSNNTFEVAFDMNNSQGPGRQATFVRSFSLTMTGT